MAKFAVGEVAIWVSEITNARFFGRLSAGDEVEIVRVGVPPGTFLSGPGAAGGEDVPAYLRADYECRHPSGYHFWCFERDLRRRPQRGIPDEVLRLFKAPIKRGEPA